MLLFSRFIARRLYRHPRASPAAASQGHLPRDRRHARFPISPGVSLSSRHHLLPDLFISPHQTHIAREQKPALSTCGCTESERPNSSPPAAAATRLLRRPVPGSCLPRSSISKDTSQCVRCIVPKWVVRLCAGQTWLSTRACARGTPLPHFIPGTLAYLLAFFHPV